MKKVAIAICFLLSICAVGQTEKKVNVVELVEDIQIWKNEDEKMTLTFWIPQSYWRISLEGNPDVPEEALVQLEDIFKEYVFLCALQVEIEMGGSMNFRSERDIRNEIIVIDENNKTYKPIPTDELPYDLQDMLGNLGPMFSKMLGQMGDGMQFYFFKIQDKNGENIINEYEEGELKVFHSGQEFVYETPLVSLLPPKYCPKDNGEMKGNWKYCPIHGVELP